MKGSHARFHASPGHPGHRRHDRRRHRRFLALSLRRRSHQQHGGPGHHRGRSRPAAPPLGLDDPFVGAIRALCRARRGRQFRHFLSAGAGRSPICSPSGCRRRSNSAFTAAVLALLLGVPMGVYTGLHRDSWPRAFMAVSLVGVSLPTFLIGILLILVFAVVLGWLPSLRARRRGASRLVDDRLPDVSRAQGADPAGDHAGAVPDDADHAAGALRDAGGAAHRLHQVRPRPRPDQPARSISATR